MSDLDPPLRTPGRDASPPLAEGSAWALAAVLLGLGVLALLSTLLPWLMGWLPELNPRRATVGAALLVFALGVELLRRAGHPRFGSALALVGMLALSAWYSVVSGLGVHSVVQAAGVLMIVLGGIYIGARAAVAMGLLALALLMVLALAERTGALPGLGLPWALTVERVLTLAVLLIGATITAVLLARLLARSIAAAQQGEQRYRELLELGADWYWELDAKGRIVAISPTFEALSGRTVAEFLQTQQPGGPQVQDDAEYQAVLATMRRREAHRNRQLTWRCADGTELVVASSGEPRLDTAGRFVGWRGTGRNITEEVRTRRALDAARREAEAVFENAAVGIALTRSGTILRVNARWVELSGMPRDQQVGRTTRETFGDPQLFDRLLELQLSRARLGLELEHEIRWQRGARPALNLLLRTHAMDPADRLDGGTVWTAEDVTEQRRTERELAEARDAAQAASRAKSAFLATMSHEIRTPINGVLGLAQMLQIDELDAARRREYLGHLLDSARQLQGIVSDVLDLSKIEAGQFDLEESEFDLLPALRAGFATFVPLAREKGLALDFEADPALPLRVRGDQLRLRQILANYLANAIKFTERGQVRLRARALPGARLRLEVEDSGIGIAPELRSQLFKPFVQADSSTTRRFGGSGLGLSICAELAQRMGGDVGLEPGPGGQGSRFWATVRLVPVQARDETAALDAAATATAAAVAPMPPVATTRTVLVAEDNPVNMIIVVALLERLGAHALQAEDGEQALAALDERAAASPSGTPGVDAVLMDLHMPRLNGWEAARAIRQRPWGATLPIHACSADVLDSARRQAEEAGMNGLLAKPLEESALKRLLDALPPRASS